MSSEGTRALNASMQRDWDRADSYEALEAERDRYKAALQYIAESADWDAGWVGAYAEEALRDPSKPSEA